MQAEAQTAGGVKESKSQKMILYKAWCHLIAGYDW